MTTEVELHDDRLLPADPGTRSIARELYQGVRDLPIISPHGHVDPALLADDEAFPDPAWLLIIPDHYVHRMLRSAGFTLDQLGVPDVNGHRGETDSRVVWRHLCEHWHLYRGTPTRFWIEQELAEVFGIRTRLSPESADAVYDELSERLAEPAFRPRALFERFNVETLATTDDATDTLKAHQRLRDSGWGGRVIPTFRPDAVVDPDKPAFADRVRQLGDMTGEDTAGYKGYLAALRQRRAHFISLGATASDHGHPTAFTCDLPEREAEELFHRVLAGASPEDAELFRGHMLMEMARMSLDDGLVLQLHPGSLRDHDPQLAARFGSDKGADIPTPTDYVHDLRPLLARFGAEPGLTIVMFTLDESAYSRELAPLAGYYPALRLGPAWWFYDSPEGIRRYRELVTETAGFYNTAGFNDDTRAFVSIPVRHDVARRIDAGYLARLVAEHRLPIDEAHETAKHLSYDLAKETYRL